MKITVNTKSKQHEFEAQAGENLYRLLARNGITLNAPCGGVCTCGQCRVSITRGVNPPTAADFTHIKAEDLSEGVRLACATTVNDDMTVNIDNTYGAAMVLTSGRMPEITVTRNGYMVAIDIGTTTVVAYLISNGTIIGIESALNAQKPYGDDVLSRIVYCDRGGLDDLHRTICAQVCELVDKLCASHGIHNSNVEQVAIVGNTIMLHILAGVSPLSIGVAPFTPVFIDNREISITGISSPIEALGGIAGYVGADVVAGVLACEMYKAEKPALFIDIGTNGEMAVGSRNGIYYCATAAGPAFEGAHIMCGIGGISGGINKLVYENGAFSYKTINDAPPVGICGSAIVDAVAALLRAEIIDETGRMEENVSITESIYIAPSDIREIQLAKAAIAAGISTLLHELGLTFDDISHCYIAGGFGNYLNIDSAVEIGLLPSALKDRISHVGNSAGSGCIAWALSDAARADYNAVRAMSTYIELSGNSYFNAKYIDEMVFEGE